MSARQQRAATFVGLFIALGLPFLIDLLLGKRPTDLAVPSRVVVFIIEKWIVALALVSLVLFWECQSLGSIGIKKMSGRDLLWGVIGFFVGAVSFILTAPIVNALGLGTTSAGIAQLAQVPVALRMAIVVTAGITEEILFRGYPIERLSSLTGRLGLGALIAYVAFVLLHIPFWGIGGTIQIGVWSLIITFLYVRRRNLLACILMHVLNDAYAFILLPMFFAQYLPQ
ncbi:MAG: CPBP family intramembrane metalloprotease [Chloroflexota bacterium]